jgi:hypothetical protein
MFHLERPESVILLTETGHSLPIRSPGVFLLKIYPIQEASKTLLGQENVKTYTGITAILRCWGDPTG